MMDGNVISVQVSGSPLLMLYAPSYSPSDSNILSGFGLVDSSGNSATVRIPAIIPPPQRSTGRSLLKFSGKWVGNDGERCLRDVYRTRTKAKF
jgi:hypothetical protein